MFIVKLLLLLLTSTFFILTALLLLVNLAKFNTSLTKLSLYTTLNYHYTTQYTDRRETCVQHSLFYSYLVLIQAEG